MGGAIRRSVRMLFQATRHRIIIITISLETAGVQRIPTPHTSMAFTSRLVIKSGAVEVHYVKLFLSYSSQYNFACAC